MSDMNLTVLSGRITRDPESRGNGKVAALTVASNRQYQQNGEWKEEVVFADVTCFGHMATKALDKLAKGSPVTVNGRLELNKWTDAEGNNRSQLRIIASQLLSPAFVGNGNGKPAAAAATDNGETEAAPEAEATEATPVAEDDIPF